MQTGLCRPVPPRVQLRPTDDAGRVQQQRGNHAVAGVIVIVTRWSTTLGSSRPTGARTPCFASSQRLSRPVGQRHAGHQNDQLPARDEPQARPRTRNWSNASRGSTPRRSSTSSPSPIRQRPRVRRRDDAADKNPRTALRVRLPRGQLLAPELLAGAPPRAGEGEEQADSVTGHRSGLRHVNHCRVPQSLYTLQQGRSITVLPSRWTTRHHQFTAPAASVPQTSPARRQTRGPALEYATAWWRGHQEPLTVWARRRLVYSFPRIERMRRGGLQ